jgi:jumonji domain-containing protein 7
MEFPSPADSIKSLTSDFLAYPIQRVHVDTLTDISFLLQYVVTRRPVILIGAVDHWKALQTWSDPIHQGFKRMISLCSNEAETSIQCTPDGYGDSVKDGLFVKPLDKRIRFEDALGRIKVARLSKPCEIPYLSGQDDCLRKDLPGLLADLGGDASVNIATNALGGSSGIEAINLWVGLDSSVSTLHKDNYDNLMTVITGCKRFLLLPPSDLLFLQEDDYTQARYVHNDAVCNNNQHNVNNEHQSCWSIQIEQDSHTVPWISVNPDKPNLERYPEFANTSPIVVDVTAGETLFLPSLWFHQVSHPHNGEITIAVNSWRDYEMMSSTYVNHEILSILKKERDVNLLEKRK